MDKEEKEFQLRSACNRNELDEAKRLVNEGVDVDSTDEDGWTPLIYAARYGHVDIIRLLLDRGADVNKKNNYGSTALYWAAYDGCVEAVKLLIERGANLHMKENIDGRTPLDWAKEYNRTSTAAIIETAMKSIKVIYTSSQELQPNRYNRYYVTFKDFSNNIILISDDDIPNGFEFEGHPVITLRHIQQCLDQLPHTADIEDDIQLDNLRLQHWGMNLLHLIAYFPQTLSNDMHEDILSLLAKYPQATTSIDIDGMTPLHHAIINLPKKKISQECHDLLLARSPPIVVHKAIEAGMDWEYLHPIVMALLDALTLEDEESSLVPFMLAAKKCNDENEDGMLGSLSMAYELLCLQPDVLKEYE